MEKVKAKQPGISWENRCNMIDIYKVIENERRNYY